MTGRTCQVLFTACSRELKNNLFGLLSSAYARKPTKLKNPQILKCQNPAIKCLDIHHLSEAVICETCLHLPNAICPNTLRGWDLLWFKALNQRPPGRMHLSKPGPARERQSLPSRSSVSGELSSLPHRCFRHHQKLQETSLHPRLLPSLEMVGFPQRSEGRVALPYNRSLWRPRCVLVDS